MTLHKIIIVDSDSKYYQQCDDILSHYTEAGFHLFETIHCKNWEEFQKEFKKCSPDIVVIDADIDKKENNQFVDFCHMYAESSYYIGIIYSLCDNFKLEQKQILNLKGDNFFQKSHTSDELVARIKHTINLKKNIDRYKDTNQHLKDANNRLEKLTITDEISDLYNMRYFNQRIEQEFLRANRYDKFLSIVMFDVDDFKNVNDTADHLLGSYVLGEIGRLILETIRTVDIGARYGGDEYVILLPETGPDGATKLALRLSEVIKNTVFDNGHHQYQVTISVGVASMGPGLTAFQSQTDLLRQADRYLYKAKEAGKDQVKCA